MKIKSNILVKAAALLLALVLVVCASVAGTLAWLTAQTEVVTNTFASAQLFENAESDFSLYESEAVDPDADGRYSLNEDNKVDSNSYVILPGVNIPKDPTVDVENLRGNAYLFITEENKLPNNLSYSVDNENWEKLEGYDGVWVYCGEKAETDTGIIKASKDATKTFTVNILTQNDDNTYGPYAISVPTDFAETVNESAANNTLSYTAYMVQATGNGDSAADAWGNTYGKNDSDNG